MTKPTYLIIFPFHFNNSNNSLNIDATSEATQCITGIDFTEQEVFIALVNLNPTKATGIYGITPHVLKNCATALINLLYYFLKSCMQQECIPREWTTHIITKPGFSFCYTPTIFSGASLMSCLHSNHRYISSMCWN